MFFMLRYFDDPYDFARHAILAVHAHDVAPRSALLALVVAMDYVAEE